MNSIKTRFTVVVIVLLFAVPAGGQTPVIDSLETLLKKHVRTDTARVDLLNKLAYEIRLHEPRKAKSYAQESAQLSSQLGYPKGQAASLWVIGITTLRSDKEFGLDCFRKALKIAENIGDKAGQCNYLIAIGNTVKLWGDTKTSDETYRRALQIAQELNDKKLILKVRINSAKNKTRSGDHIEAIRQLQEVVKIAKEIDYKEVLARAYADLGLIYNIRGSYPIALEYHLSSLVINEKRNDYVGVYDNLINISGIQSEQNDFDAALGTAKKAQRLATEKRDSMRISRSLNYIGNIYERMNRPEALGYFQKSLSMSKFNKPAEDINNLINIGSIYSDRDEFAKAMTSFNEALALARKADIKRVSGEVHGKIGALYFKQKRYAPAQEHIRKALTLAVETHSTDLQKDCQKLLSDIYAATGNFKHAYACHTQYKLLYDSIINEKSTRKTALLESAHKFDKEREGYEQDKAGRELRIKSQQLTILSLVLISFLILLLSVAIYWSSRLRKKVLRLEIEHINRELEANQKAIAVARLKLVQNSERDAQHVKLLKDIEKDTVGEGHRNLGLLINNYKFQTHHSNWEEFETLFTKVNASFWDQLNELYPNLTPNERKLCVFLKLNMSNKDIALITFQSDEALKKSRLRLRQKFGLDRGTNLTAFIQNL